MELPKPVLVAAGGIAGAGVRWAILHLADDAAWAIIGVNLVGAFVLALIARSVEPTQDSRRLLIGVGFCGALTTFSTLALEAAQHLDTGAPADAAALLAGSLATGVAAALAGLAVRRRLA